MQGRNYDADLHLPGVSAVARTGTNASLFTVTANQDVTINAGVGIRRRADSLFTDNASRGS